MERIIVKVDPDIYDLIPDYLKARRENVLAISDALSKDPKDFDTVASLSHIMKGSGGGYGFDRITEIGTTMERAAKEHQTDLILEQLKKLTQYLDHIDVIPA